MPPVVPEGWRDGPANSLVVGRIHDVASLFHIEAITSAKIAQHSGRCIP